MKDKTDLGTFICCKCGKPSKIGKLYYSCGRHSFMCKNCQVRRVSRITETDFYDSLENLGTEIVNAAMMERIRTVNRELLAEAKGLKQIRKEELENKIAEMEAEIEALKEQL